MAEAKQSIAAIVRTRAAAGMGPVVMVRVRKSSNVAAVGYDRPTRTLYVEFLKGYRPRKGRVQKARLKANETTIYKYFNVPQGLYTQMVHAPSKGKYLHRRIKGKFRYQMLGRAGWRGPKGGHRAQAHKPSGFKRK